jgi:hypothetical protein
MHGLDRVVENWRDRVEVEESNLIGDSKVGATHEPESYSKEWDCERCELRCHYRNQNVHYDEEDSFYVVIKTLASSFLRSLGLPRRDISQLT